jgi:uncharacterized protein DUF4190
MTEHLPPPTPLPPPAPVPPDHPRSTAALAVGIVSVVGALFVVPAALGPLACYLGLSARRAIERDPGRWSGHGQATAGLVLGIIATVLLVMLAVAALVFAGLFALALRIDTGYGR